MSNLSPADVLDILDPEPTIKKRASWEFFAFSVIGGERVEVIKKSYSASEEHTYTVYVGGVIQFSCSCPVFKYRDGPCKHMVAVAMEVSLIDAGNAAPSMRPDGGVTVEKAESNHSDERSDNCDCTPLMEGLPCWPCYRNGFEEPTPNTSKE